MTNQNDFVIDNGTGLAVRQDIQDALQALAGLSSGDSAPSTTYAFQLYANTSTDMLQIRNAANSAFIDLFQLDGTFTLEDGSASTPALSARNDLNTGVFFSAADKFNIATGGVERVEFGTTTIFNEDGADVDFRIEGDTNANLFFVDAGNERIGIGLNTPLTPLHIKSADNTLATFESTDADALIKFQDNSTSDVISMGALGGDNLLIRCDAGNIVFHVANNNEKVRIQSGGGISFNGDTAAAYALDDYEEGSWTPVLGATTTDPTISSYSHQTGRYTKIGNVVNLFMFIDIAAGNITNAGSGDGLIRGLPFAIDPTTGDQNGAAMINFAQLPNTFSSGRNDYRFKFGAGEDILRIHQYSSDNPQVQTGLGSGQIANGNRFKVGFVAVYRTNA